MDKQAMWDQVYEAAFNDELKKIAFGVDDIEDSMDTYFTPEQISVAQKLIDEHKRNSFSLRHPWLTGIPTLGLAPLIARSYANDQITRAMAHNDPAIAKAVQAVKQKQHEIDVAAAGSPETYNVLGRAV